MNQILILKDLKACRKALQEIGEYTGEGPGTTPWQGIVRDMGEKAREVLRDQTAEISKECLHETVEMKNVDRFLGDYVHSGQCKACGVKVYRMRGRRWVADLEDFVEES